VPNDEDDGCPDIPDTVGICGGGSDVAGCVMSESGMEEMGVERRRSL